MTCPASREPRRKASCRSRWLRSLPTIRSFGPTPTFRPKVPLVRVEVGMEPQFYAVTPDMEIPLHGIGINFTDHVLYLMITPEGGFRVIPVNCETDNEYTRTKETGLLDGVKKWVRLYTDKAQQAVPGVPCACGPL